MKLTELECRLLRKLKNGQLDGTIYNDYHARREQRIYRKMIVGGVPYFFNFPMGEEPTRENVEVDGHFETDEMKLWFLYVHGRYVNDPDAQIYSASDGMPPELQKDRPKPQYRQKRYRVSIADLHTGRVLKELASPFLYKADAEGYVDYCQNTLAEAAEILQGSGCAYTESGDVEFVIRGYEEFLD